MNWFIKRKVQDDTIKQLKAEKKSLTVELQQAESALEALRDELTNKKRELKDLDAEQRRKEQDIAHMVRINDERKDLELEKATQKIEAAKQKEIGELKDGHRDALEGLLKKQLEDGEKRFADILARLPDVNTRLRIDS